VTNEERTTTMASHTADTADTADTAGQRQTERSRCPGCHLRPAKLPGLTEPLCLTCFAAERLLFERKAAASTQSYVTACIADARCPGCDGTNVDASGALWWCNDCGICTRVDP
jgi:hypothetical protein